MALIEITEQGEGLTLQQRWSHIFTVGVALLALLYGLNLRASTLNATAVYTNVEAGIRVNYPQNWLIDEEGDYIFRVRDMTRIGFKTTIRLETLAVGPTTTERNVRDTLNINRPLTLDTYNVLNVSDYVLPDENEASLMTYTFVDTDTNPFLESVPTVVIGQDVITIQGGQAIIISFLADASTFDNDLTIFNNFLNSLEFR